MQPNPTEHTHGADDLRTSPPAGSNPAELEAHHQRVHHATPIHDRGMAVLLALVAVSLAVLIGLAVASSRDANTSATGGIVLAASARTASAGALDVAEYISRQHSTSLAGNPAEGSRLLFAPKQIGTATISATVRDATTAMSPSIETAGLAIEASASVNGVTTPTTTVRRVEWGNIESRADFDLSEFAMLTTTGGISIGAGSEVSVWRDAPLARLGEPLVIGSRLRDPAAVTIDRDALVLGYAVLAKGKFAANAAAADRQLADRTFTIPTDVTAPASPTQGAPSTCVSVNFNQFAQRVNQKTSGNVVPDFRIFPANMVVGRSVVPIPPPKKLVVEGPKPAGTWRMIFIEGDLALTGCDWTFNERTMLVVRNNLTLTNSRIKVGPLGSLSVLVNGRVTLTGSTVGPDDGNGGNSWDPNGEASYRTFGASRVVVYAQRAAVALDRASVLKGQIYAPAAAVTIGGGSAVYGRVLGASIALTGRSNLFYDPELNAGTGWLNPRSGIWWRTNEVRAETARIAILNDQQLSMFSKASMIAVDEPETGMIATVYSTAAGGFGTVTSNSADSGTAANGNMTPNGSVAGAALTYPDLYLIVNGILRDFRESSETSGHPDFDNPLLTPALRWGLVAPQLSADGKPVLANGRAPNVLSVSRDSTNNPIAPGLYDKSRGDIAGRIDKVLRPTITDAQSFSSWFRDVPGVNLSEPYRIIMRRVVDAQKRQTYVFDSNSADPFYNDGAGPKLDGFFPLEDRLFGNSLLKTVMLGRTPVTRDRNYHFTLELSMQFTYDSAAGQTFMIQGNDDIWAFIDGKLVVDLGGMHASTWQIVPIDRLGLSQGQKSTLKVFYANRSRPNSHLRIATNFPLADPLPPPPPPGPAQFLQQLASQRDMTRVQFVARR